MTGCSADPDTPETTNRRSPDQLPAPAAPAMISPVETDPPAAADPTAAPRLVVEAEGMRWFLPASGSAHPIAFGSPQSELIGSLERIRGSARKGTNENCGAGPVEVATWQDGLTVIFQNGRFVGWGFGQSATGEIATAAGIRPGSTRAELDGAYDVTVSQTTLGSEFNAGGLQGLLDGPSADARIIDMWAGVSCVAR
ncbi:hypothetical protein [Roseibium sp.]|uniref:hypothetical protein n=1 Tax=Roseibium sp. TaxID=1936156 RepID=UPI00329A10B2